MRLVWVLIIIGVLFFAWKKAPDFIASKLSDKMQVEVKIQDIGLSTNEVKVQKVEIANPAGSTLPKAFTVDTVQVDAPLTNYVKDQIVIDQVALNNIYISLELASANGMAGNWGKIIDNIKQTSGPQETKAENNKSILIKKLVLTNINVDLVNGLLGGKVQKLDPIPRLEFENVSSVSGVPLEQVISLIVTAVLKQENVGNFIEKAIENPKEMLDQINPFK